MTVSLWRIASDTPEWTADDLAGIGAAARGGRWNDAGEPVTYTSASIALAAWETRAHLGRAGSRLPYNRFLVRIDVPDAVWAARTTAPRPLPVGWNAVPEGRVSRRLGSAWLKEAASALFVAPSVIVPEEDNVLVNPAHPDARRLAAVKLRRFLYDPRVTSTRRTGGKMPPMLFLLSPAKTLDYETPHAVERPTTPAFLPRSAELIEVLKTKSVADIAVLMQLSEPLAALNVGRYGAWRRRATAHNSKPALLAFNGDVYEGLDAKTLSADDLAWAQCHLAVLSGLYGVLRPLDRLQPYRLEMGTPLATAQGRNLYDYWGDAIALHLNRRARADATPVVVNLASQEYFKAVDRRVLKPRVVDCVFEDWQAGGFKVVGFYAKRARGLMARWAITRRVATPGGLLGFDSEGYAHDAVASAPDRLVFRRRRAG